MKKLSLFLSLCLLWSGVAALPVRAADSKSRMIAAAMLGDAEAGRAAEGADTPSFDELYLLSKALFAVTGSRTYTEEWRLCIGEVILNRVASPEFPDTLQEVIYADERYCGKADGYFEALRPDAVCAEIAWRLLCGERIMDDGRVVYQDEHFYDGGVCKSLYDYRAGGIFFCYTTKPQLYR